MLVRVCVCVYCGVVCVVLLFCFVIRVHIVLRGLYFLFVMCALVIVFAVAYVCSVYELVSLFCCSALRVRVQGHQQMGNIFVSEKVVRHKISSA